MYLHELPNVQSLFEKVAVEKDLLPAIIEKDYWLMHCLYGLQHAGYKFEMKGGTSLSKGFNIIERFSEDIDLQIHPSDPTIKIGRNHDKPLHIESRAKFFNNICNSLKIDGLVFSRETNFDDATGKMRGAGINAEYQSMFNTESSLKKGLILELGFDQTTPYIPCLITSWAYNKASELQLPIKDNRAKDIACYCPEYTFVEKLQTISTKYRLQQANKVMPINFLRHYYDVYKLLESERVLDFIGTPAYFSHKKNRFRGQDEQDISKNDAFIISNNDTRMLYSNEFKKKSAIYFGTQPSFEDIIKRIQQYKEFL